MNKLEFDDFMAEMDGNLLYNDYVNDDENNKRPIQIAYITIPGDKKTFNQMWLDKTFDYIDPTLHIKFKPVLHNYISKGIYQWDEYFFKRREDLMYMSAVELWESSEYYDRIALEIDKLYPIYQLNNYQKNVVSRYLSQPVEAIMFPNKTREVEYMNPLLLQIYKDTVTRFQYIIRKMNNERISIYMGEMESLSHKIQFIHILIYFGFDPIIYRFFDIKKKNTDVAVVTDDIEQEPNEFIEEKYRVTLYKFYLLRVSNKCITQEITNKSDFLASILLNYDDIIYLIKNYLLPLCSCIRQDKLKTVCCQTILDYLRPKYVTERYIEGKVTRTVLLNV
jgi:hypothetical protein